MDRKLRILKSVLFFLFLVGVLFATLALLPAWAQAQERGRAGPDEPLDSELGNVSAQLLVSSTTGYVIDDGWAGFTMTLSPDGWTAGAVNGYDSDYLYSTANSDGDYAEWRPDLAAGTYEVQVHYFAHSNRRTDAEYKIWHSGGVATQLVDQQVLADGSPGPGNSGWYGIGAYPFVAGTSGYVRLSDATAAGSGTFVCADAVRFLANEVWVDDNYCSACTNDGHLWGVTAFDNIRDGIAAVANRGTVRVGPGSYYQNLTVTKSITMSGAGAASTVISVTGALGPTAIEMRASDVHISGFTIEGTGVAHGIRNFAPYDHTGYSISSNVIRGFTRGIRLRRASGVISNNTIHDNTRIGIWVEDFPSGTSTGPTIVSANVLHTNGFAAEDSDIRVEDSYTGTMVSGNTITGSSGANADEACIYVRDEAGGLVLSTNSIMSCTRGISITQVASSIAMQTVDLRGNTITGGTTGVLAGRYPGTSWSARQLTIGGSLGNANSIYNNGSPGGNDELELIRYRGDIDATYNYWGVCDLRAIEDEIYHYWDNPVPSIGTVTYEPALCVPYTIDVEAAPPSLPADGISTATITATVRDVAGQRAQPGTMIGITTSLGSVLYGYAEAEDTSQVVRTGSWATPGAFGRASGGQVLRASNPARRLDWTFTGEAVSLLYAKDSGGGLAEVRVDGVLLKTIDMSSSQREFRVEEVISTTLDPTVSHTIDVRPDGSGDIWIDAFRSGGVVATQGRIVTTLTSTATAGIADIWGTVYDGHIITATSTALYPIITDTATVLFQSADVHIAKSVSPTSINSGQEATYTIDYGNNGPETATNVVVTDTLPTDFVYVRSSSSPDREPPTSAPGNKYVWNVGDLASGATGTITLVARPDQSLPWCVPVVRTNSAEIAADLPDAVAGNNTTGAVPVTVVVPTAVAISAHPPTIRVSNGTIATTLRITVTDSSSNLVHGVPVSLTTTAGTFPASGGTTLVVTTTNGVALASLASETTVTTATVTAEVLPACGGMPTAIIQVPFVPALPYEITGEHYPSLIRVCGDEAVVTATIKDEFGNLVADGTEVTLNVVQGDRGDMHPRLTTTVGGVATSIVRTKAYMFGERFLDVYILAQREAQRAEWYERVDLEEGPPYSVALTPSPPVLPVGGWESEIWALVQDCGGNNVQDGTVVTFTANALGTISPTVTSTLNGRAVSVFRSGCTIGTAVVTATADSALGVTTFALEPGPADLISVGAPVPPSIRNCGGQAEISATLWDVCGNLVKDGTPVLFTPQYNYVDADPKLAYTSGGMASTTVTALDKTLETWPTALEQIDVTSGSALPGFASLTIEPGLPENVEVSANPGEIPINGDVNFFDIIVEAEVTDCSGTPVEDGTSVELRTDLGIFRESGMRLLPRMTVNGLVTGTLTSQSIAGLVTITATADSAVGTTTVRFLPGEPWLLEVWGYPTTIPADGLSTSLITAWVKDEYNNPVLDGVTVTLVTDYGYFVESGDVMYTTTTTFEGYVFSTLVSDPIPRTALVRAIAYNDRQGYTYVFFVVPRYIYLPLVIRRAIPVP